MPEAELQVLDRSRVAISGLALPTPPPARIYLSGHLYKIAAPTISATSLANTMKIILNWSSTVARVAKNIGYVLTGSAVDTTDPAFLKAVANQVMTSWSSAGVVPNTSPQWTLQSVTCKDNSGVSSSVATSDHSPLTGSNASNSFPPQVSVVWSWSIAASYRGGKPRWYLPGVPTNAANAVGDSALTSAFATAMEVAANAFAVSFNSSSPLTHSVTLGTISFQTGHAPRPTPLFRPFGTAKVHERMDSQRRRSGKESLFPVVP